MVVFSAHGVAPSVHANAAKRRLRTIDATCPLVTKVHVEARKFAKDGYTIVLIGHEGHEEVEGTTGEAPDRTVLVQTEADVDALEVEDPNRIAYITQTTLSVDETSSIIARLRGEVPQRDRAQDGRHLLRDHEPPVCGQGARPRVRPRPRHRLHQLVQPNRLVEVAREHGAASHLIDNHLQVDDEAWLEGVEVGIASGASASEELVERLVASSESGARPTSPS